jgi:hydroxyethylthiazole kinase
MTSVTGMGCTATALTGAFAAVCEDAMTAAVAAMAVMSEVGERAAAQARGNGSMQMHFLDELYNLTSL